MNFTWIKFYNELFLKIVKDYDSKSLAKVAYEIFPEKGLMDRDSSGNEFRLVEFEPCTFLARFNRKEKNESRIAYCKKAKSVLGLTSEIPSDFAGIPIFQNMAFWLFPFKDARKGFEFPALWNFSRELASGNVSEKSFNAALESPGAGLAYLTMICYIVWPEKYLPLDKRTTQYLAARNEQLSNRIGDLRKMDGPFSEYKRFLESTSQFFSGKNFAEISLDAYLETSEKEFQEQDASEGDAEVRIGNGPRYWVAGANWRGEKVEDKTAYFIKEGIWQNGFAADSGDKSVQTVKQAKAGDYIAIKSSSTKGPGHKTPFIKVKAIGVITQNAGDGVNLKVDWIYKGPEFDVDGIAYRRTFDPVIKEKLIGRIFKPVLGKSKSRALEDSVTNKKTLDTTRPRNVIYWGPPGTGKTYQILQLQDEFEDQDPSAASDQIVQWVQEATWWEAIAAAMIDIGKPVSVPELFEHEFIQIKAKQAATKTPKNTLWGSLQSHTVHESKTVNFERRQEPLVVDKSTDSKWFLTNNWEEQLSDLVADVKHLRDGDAGGVNRRYEMVTFHQSYSYEEFVEGIRPEPTDDGSGIRYDVKPGIFRQICERAQENPEKQYAIFIDEINRGNISKIFGELITLIEPDKRLGQPHEVTITLPYSKKSFGVPDNVHIIGTMNSVDRSIALVDMALRRRFEFVAVRPNKMLVSADGIPGVNIRNVFTRLNEKISALLGSEYQLGHSYFMGSKASSLKALKATWFGSVLPLLQEYFFDDWSKMKALVGGFVIETPIAELESVALAKSTFGSFVESDLPDEKFVELLKALE